LVLVAEYAATLDLTRKAYCFEGSTIDTPADISVYGDEIYVLEAHPASIKVFHRSTGTFLRQWGNWRTYKDEQHGLRQPSALAINRGEIYVTDTINHNVQVFHHTTCSLMRSWSSYTWPDPNQTFRLSCPSGVCFEAGDRLLVSDSYYDRILVFTKHGKLMHNFGCGGTRLGEFRFPTKLFGDWKDLFIVDSQNNRIQAVRFRQSPFTFLSYDLPNRAQAASVVAHSDQVIASYPKINQITVFDRDSCEPVQTLPFKPDCFRPCALAVTVQNELFVTDGVHHKILVFH
jgi:hypothetical protein